MTPAETAELENLQHRLDQALAEVARVTAALQAAESGRESMVAATVEIAKAAAFAYGSLRGMAETVLAGSPEHQAMARRHAAKIAADCRPYVNFEELVSTHGIFEPGAKA